jgi:hypothetical protein
MIERKEDGLNNFALLKTGMLIAMNLIRSKKCDNPWPPKGINNRDINHSPMINEPITRLKLREEYRRGNITIDDLDMLRDEHPFLLTSRLQKKVLLQQLEMKLEKAASSMNTDKANGTIHYSWLFPTLKDADSIVSRAKDLRYDLSDRLVSGFDKIIDAACAYHAHNAMLMFIEEVKSAYDLQKQETRIRESIPDAADRHVSRLLTKARRKAKRLKKCCNHGSTPFYLMIEVLKEAAPLKSYHEAYDARIDETTLIAYERGVEYVREQASKHRACDKERYKRMMDTATHNELMLNQYQP